ALPTRVGARGYGSIYPARQIPQTSSRAEKASAAAYTLSKSQPCLDGEASCRRAEGTLKGLALGTLMVVYSFPLIM
ncbi:MAG TPA: hypothetical protein VMK42_00725, partial [Anaeromyxobacteraceae bacterium]|nr:hypothetical protein [Anaeromyxobacteraceae bacterium]